ncbi:MAG: hypothetical protein WC969_02870 [Elusimicrobiota bacterium]|jgi:hypothetical protein
MEALAAVVLATSTLLSTAAPITLTPPEGYKASDARLGAPIVAVFSKRLHDGEAALIVERYAAEDPDGDPAVFARNLGAGARRAVRKIGGRAFELYEGIDVETFTRQVQQGDPYAETLGTSPSPPRLSFFESRRFPKGGDAYRLYRCIELDAWRTLRRYRSLKAGEGDLAEFRSRLSPVQRQVVSTCFGTGILMAMAEGEQVPDIPKPSMYRLRIMARDEWQYGSTRKVERESVHLRPIRGGGFYALRLRAPREAFSGEKDAFDAFLTAFAPPDAAP